MQEFLNIALGFPTVIWTVLLTVVVLYWLFVILGALDIDLLDLDLDVDFDVDLDLDFDADADVEVDVDGAQGEVAGPSGLMKLAIALGLGKVPVTLLISFFTAAGWALSFLGMYYLAPVVDVSGIGAAILALSFLIALPAMGVMAKPFEGMFKHVTRKAGSTLVGGVCEVSTGSVSDSFGQAVYEDGGAGLLLAIRCESDNDLRRGSQALIIGHDVENDIYWVEPYEQFLAPEEGVSLASSVEAEHEVEELVNAKREA